MTLRPRKTHRDAPISSRPRTGLKGTIASRIVHLELHTGDSARACAFYGRLFGWRFESIRVSSGSYLAMDLGNGIGGGVAECEARPAGWMPYIEVDAIDAATDRARELGAAVLLEPREGPAGWRSVVAAPGAGELGLWQPKPAPRARPARAGQGRRDMTMPDQQLLAAARTGDERAYADLVEPHRGELHAHCYRMLGSVQDAEDALQDAMVRAWRGLPRFQGRSSLRSWLYKITTNACLDAIARRPKRVLPIEYGPPTGPQDQIAKPLVESIWIEPYPDELVDIGDRMLGPEARYEQRESVELAFVAALQHLPAKQRAVLILREVLGFSAAETADVLDTTVQSVNSALQRARKAADERLPEESQQATLWNLGDKRLQELVDTYMTAWEAGEVETIVAMLTDDVTLAMPPMPTWFQGRAGVRDFLTRFAFADQEQRRQLVSYAGEQRRVRLVPMRANGQPAFAGYFWNDEQGAYLPRVLQVLTLRQGHIDDITGFVDPGMLAPFGLPERLR